MDAIRKFFIAGYTLILWTCLLFFAGTGCAHRRGQDPLTPEERLELGLTYEKIGQTELALESYERVPNGPLSARAWTYHGNTLVQAGQTLKAEQSYRRALEHDPDFPEALNNLAWLLADEKRNGSEALEALELIQRALRQDPVPLEAYQNTLNRIQEMLREKGE